MAGLFFEEKIMKLVENWRAVIRGAWSVRLMVIAAILSALPVFFSLLNAQALGLSPVVFAALSALASAGAVVARIVQQASLAQTLRQFTGDESGAARIGRRALGGALVALVLAASPFVAGWEGLRTQAYQDVIGVWTVCYGETKGVERGDAYSTDECKAMLERELRGYAVELGKCLKAPLPEGAAVAFLSWSYNVGTGAACKSTAVRKANAGDLFGACDELLRWTRAGGRVVPGLVNRRTAEHGLCTRSLIAAGLSRADRK
jgi:GH24 family phage-related lysozyme (muramidase)